MGAVSSYAEKVMLDFILKGVTTAAPAAWGVGLSLGVPTSVSGSEIALASGITRQTVAFSAATGSTAQNSAAITWGTAVTPMSITGIQVWDTSSSTNGSMLWYGTLSAARTLASGDYIVIAAGALVISLA